MKKFYHYTECGLDNVYLANGFSVRKDGALFIEDIHGLHRFIGEKIVFQPRRLKGREVRFIRHYMDLSQKAFGEMLGVDYQTVLRWETGKNVIPNTADRFLRVIFHEYLDPESRARAVVETLSDLDNDRHDGKLELLHRKEWKEVA
jgi:DNA-binding transcriptional regulator YiaG